MNAWGITSAGVARQENQDAYEMYIPLGAGKGACVVCDGMGGAKGGDVASRTAVNGFIQEVVSRLKPSLRSEQLADIARSAAERANYLVYRKACDSPEFEGMGTTLVAALFSGKSTVVANVGDSRAYWITKESITLLTTDHSVVEDMIKRGDITRESARRHPIKNLITRAVGTEREIDCDIFKTSVRPGEYILLCSDGLSNTVSEPEILFEVVHGGGPSTCCQRLLEIAIRRGAPDNVTIVLIER